VTGATRYLLDTNIVSDLAREPQGHVARRVVTVGVERIAVSVIVACELRFGAAKSGSRRLAKRIDLLLDEIPQLPLEAPVAAHYADIRTRLERAGTPIGPNDLLIAAHARALGCVLVTDNERELARVPRLAIENWRRD
jgi:tRNA(fMet)-specific endonuclease VapC